MLLLAALAVAPSLHAQQQAPVTEPSGPEQVIEAIGNTLRDFFRNILGTGEAELPAPQGQPEQQEQSPRPGAQQPAPQPPAPQAAPQTPPQPIKVTPRAEAAPQSLQALIAKGEYDAALKMLDSGADIEGKDPGAGASPLHYAVMKGALPMVSQLLTRGADVNSRTKSGTTPLHTAALYNRFEVAELLLARGADINAKSVGGATPLTIAETAHYQRIAKLLRERGAQ
jgi:ankyrin repeat protein